MKGTVEEKLVCVLLALLVAGSAAGPIKAVAEPNKPETQYVFVKLLFEGKHALQLAATISLVVGPGSATTAGKHAAARNIAKQPIAH